MVDWNDRYKKGEHTSREPHRLIVQFAAGLTPGRALDLACGVGRHAIWLAERGWQVAAVDYSSVAIEMLRHIAGQKGVIVDARAADLERHEFTIEPLSYDLIVLCNYRQPDLFSPIRAGVPIGGHVIAVIAMADSDPNVKPMNPAFLVNPGELRAEFEGWELAWYFEGKSGKQPGRATAEIVAKRVR